MKPVIVDKRHIEGIPDARYLDKASGGKTMVGKDPFLVLQGRTVSRI